MAFFRGQPTRRCQFVSASRMGCRRVRRRRSAAAVLAAPAAIWVVVYRLCCGHCNRAAFAARSGPRRCPVRAAAPSLAPMPPADDLHACHAECKRFASRLAALECVHRRLLAPHLVRGARSAAFTPAPAAQAPHQSRRPPFYSRRDCKGIFSPVRSGMGAGPWGGWGGWGAALGT